MWQAEELLHLSEEMSDTPLTDAVVNMRRHDRNTPEVWCTDDVIEIIKHARTLERRLAIKQCAWKQWDGGQYETACGNVFEFTHEGVQANSAKFCQYCGGTILEIPYTEPKDE